MPRCLHPAGGHRLRSIKSGGDSELATQRAVRLRRGGATLEDIARLARDLKGIRVCHINSTGFGGGVAELLARYVPMASALGIDTDWRLLHRTTEFFTITKALHNALQVAPYGVSETDKPIYIHVNRESAASLDAAYDLVVVHDPQPAAFRQMAGQRAAKWIWRCHIDTSGGRDGRRPVRVHESRWCRKHGGQRVPAQIRDPARRETFGRDAREHVRRHFLLPRLLRDELQLIKRVLGR